MIVADASILAPFWMPSEFSNLSDQVHRKDPDWVAPLLWRSEVRNTMVLYMRHDLLSLGEILEFMEKAEHQMKEMEYQVNSTSVLRYTSESKASAYDCEYISLAEELGVPLVTNDHKLTNLFPDVAQSPEQFLGN